MSANLERLRDHRAFFAKLITASAGVPEGPVRAAFAATPREQFVGPGPWQIMTATGYVETPSSDPAFLYQDVLIALKKGGPINNGQPTLHALCLGALHIQEGERILHVGAGTGYYTALLARLTGPAGSVVAYEIDPELANRATANLAEFSNVTVRGRSGVEAPLPECDVLYVNAGATSPLNVWLDTLRPHGRLLFPLTPAEGFGGMLLITRSANDRWNARFLTRAMFIPCIGARDDDTAYRLGDAFKHDNFAAVRSLRRNTAPDETCWFAGEGWWLSTAAP